MRQNHRKLRQMLFVLTLLLTVALTGCGKKDSTAAGSKSEDGGLSRARYVGMLADSFGYDSFISESDLFQDVSSMNEYYAEIQAAAERQIVEQTDEFEPDKAATIEFALECAVRAVDTDDIAASGAAIDLNNLADFYVNNIAQIDLSNPEASIDTETAEQIIAYAMNYDNNLVLPQITEMEFMEGVKTAASGIKLNADGATGEFFSAEGYSVGDIVYIDATDTSLARAVKITGIEGNSFTFEEASIEETYSNLHIQGSFPGKVVEVISASDGASAGLAQDIYDEMKAYNMASSDDYVAMNVANSAKVDSGSDHIVFTASFDVQKSASMENRYKKNYSNLDKGVSKPDYSNSIDTDASANGQMVVGIKNIRADVKYEHKTLRVLSPEEIELKLHFDTEISSEVHGSVSASIPLGEAYIQVWGPLNIKVMLTAHLGADGNVSISYTTENVMTVGWKEGCGLQKSFNSSADADFEADATLTAEATLLTDLRVGFKSVSYSLANAQVSSGAVAVAKMEADLLGEQPTCVDLQLYVPLKWGVNQEGCLLTDISGKLKYNGTIWDSSNSPVKMHMHLEDWERTPGDECTRTEEVEQELTTPEGEPLEEIDPFEFEMLEFDFIELVSYTMYLGQGENMNIGFESIPEGYSQADLKYEVLDSSICSVSNGAVHGNTVGSTIVKISTSDGMFTVSLAVTVNDDYEVEGFQAL